MWADLLQRLQQSLARELPEVIVVTHAEAEVPEVATVRILRGETAGKPLYSWPQGVQNLTLELWVKDTDYAAADRQLMALEQRVGNALEQMPRDGLISKIDVLGIEPDGDLFRPALGSGMRLKVHWRQPRR
jgi:uncharacterized ParB-like nuclease family protein